MVELSELDTAILRELQNNRRTNRAIAQVSVVYEHLRNFIVEPLGRTRGPTPRALR